MSKIPIMLASDYNFIFWSMVTIHSLKNSALVNTEYDIFLCVPKKEIEEITREVTKYFWDISIISIDERLFEGCVIKDKMYTPVTFYRMVADKYIGEYKKCIYLDSDIVVLDDLSSLYNIEMEDNYFLGVKDYELQFLNMQTGNKVRELEIPTIDNYINAGVTVINLDKLRAEPLFEEFLNLLDKGYEYNDQDIINKCCFGKIGLVPLKFNFRNYYYEVNCSHENIMEIDGLDTLEEARKHIAILHYAGKYDKPWKNCDAIGGEIWWGIAEQLYGKEKLNKIISKVSEDLKPQSKLFLEDICKLYDKVVVFGLTKTAKSLIDGLVEGNYEIYAILDNQVREYKAYQEIPIYSIDEFAYDTAPKCLYINMGVKSKEEMQEMLLQKGISRNNIFNYFDYRWKNQNYYELLPHKLYKQELIEIFMIEKFNCAKDDFEEMKHEIRKRPDICEKYYLNKWLFLKN